MTQDTGIWLFGYGSLLFKPPLHHLEIHKAFRRFDGHSTGFVRRFWQSSYDNRGTPEFKGRVVTIIPSESIACNEKFQEDVSQYELAHLSHEERQRLFENEDQLRNELKVNGCVYYIPPEHAQEASEYLDFREKDGYDKQIVEFHVNDSSDPIFNGSDLVKCVVYVGTEDNESFIGPEAPEKTASIIKIAHGDSGANDEYLLLLLDDLERIGVQDLYLSHLKSLITT